MPKTSAYNKDSDSVAFEGCPSLPSESIVHSRKSHCTMGQVVQSMGIPCPTIFHCPSYPTVPCRIGGTVHGNPLSLTVPLWPTKSYCPSYPTVPCRIGGTVYGNPLYHSGPPNPTTVPGRGQFPASSGWTRPRHGSVSQRHKVRTAFSTLRKYCPHRKSPQPFGQTFTTKSNRRRGPSLNSTYERGEAENTKANELCGICYMVNFSM